jgi:UDP-GlcNAc:undecaprenyl-phosphate/decaprenyl-phosphate GlcNAc-1-phosphate transferase
MYSLLLLGLASFVFSLFLTPFVRDQARRLGLVDHPDVHRKVHNTPVPRVGGVAILGATIAAFALLLLTGLNARVMIREALPFALRLLPAVLIIFGVGLADDILDLKPWYKLGGQVAAAIFVWSAGVRLVSIEGHPFPAWASLFLTVLWIVACSNAVNLIDGVDGLAAGAALFATITSLIAGLLHGNMALAFATAPLAGALIGFLRFNFNPASIFLGDCGSLTLGFMLGCYGIVWSEKSTTLIGMTAPLLALAVPLLDVSISIARRFLRQQPIFRGDYHHIHHKMLSRGLTPRRVVLVLYGFCGLAAAASLIITKAHRQYQGLVIVLVSVTAWYSLQHLDYGEFTTASRLVFGGGFRRRLNAHLHLMDFERQLADCNSIDRCWDVLCAAYPDFGFSGVEFAGEIAKRHGIPSGNWIVQINLQRQATIRFFRSGDARGQDSLAVLFLDTIALTFKRKIDELSEEESGIPAFANAD